jgi:hypothetical protein
MAFVDHEHHGRANEQHDYHGYDKRNNSIHDCAPHCVSSSRERERNASRERNGSPDDCAAAPEAAADAAALAGAADWAVTAEAADALSARASCVIEPPITPAGAAPTG